MKNRVIHYPKNLFSLTCVLVSLVSTVICVSKIGEMPVSFSNLWLLPLGNAVVSLVFFCLLLKGEFFVDIPLLIITTLFLVRNSITPLVMAITTCASRLGIYSNAHMINIGIAAFVYETTAVYIYCIYTNHKRYRNKKVRKCTIKVYGDYLFYLLLIGGVLFGVVCFITLPEIRTQYYSIFTSGITQLAKKGFSYSSGIKRALSTAGNMIIEAVRITLFSYIIFKLHRYKTNLVTYLVSIGVILLQFLFMNDSNAYILMLAFSLYLLIYRLNPRRCKQTIKYLLIFIALFGALLYINRFSKDIYGKSLSVFLQAYLPGLNNFATIEPLLDRSITEIVSQIFIDAYAAVPFRSTLFGYDGNLNALPTLWSMSNGLTGQIMPNIAQSYYYFGPVLCPILSICLAKIGTRSFKKASLTENPCMYTVYIYLGIYACVSITMYDFYIFLCNFLTRYMFMWALSYWCKDKMSPSLVSNIVKDY